MMCMRLNHRMNHITKCRLSTFFSLSEGFTKSLDRKTTVKLILRNLMFCRAPTTMCTYEKEMSYWKHIKWMANRAVIATKQLITCNILIESPLMYSQISRHLKIIIHRFDTELILNTYTYFYTKNVILI